MTAPTSLRRQSPVEGMVLMAACMLVLPVMDAIAKYMATVEGMSPGQVTFYRFFFQLACTLPVLFLLRGRDALAARRPYMNLLRGCLHGAASLMFFAAVKYMPLADVFAIYFVEPFILTALSALFLKGAIGEADSPMTMQTMSGIGGTLIMGAALLAGTGTGASDLAPSLPSSWLGLGLLVLLGSISGYIHLLIVRAFRLAPLSVLAPFQYFEIIAATVLGYALFGEFPDASKWTGVAIIVGSGLFILWREQKRAKRAAI